MQSSPFEILLVGNSPYTNRGSEAIVRGTMAILRHEFGDDFRATVASIGLPEDVAQQAARETDPLLEHVLLRSGPHPRWSCGWFLDRLARKLGCRIYGRRVLDAMAQRACCALEVGGDNYSLDYGRPVGFMKIDNRLLERGVPVVLWGASVGPFEVQPEFAPQMFNHLRRMQAVLVRERWSYQYLQSHGVDGNLYLVADPAFVMDAVECEEEKIGCAIPPQAIGLNFSPLMAKYVTKGDVKQWTRRCAEIVREVRDVMRRDLVLVPHVTSAHTNDYQFLEEVAARIPKTSLGNVACVSDRLSAAETKWVISKCRVFVGARMHSVIAAISSCVPTLSLAYSIKAQGLNQDVFGSHDYCLDAHQITPQHICRQITKLFENQESLRNHLQQVLPEIRERAFSAGALLRTICQEPCSGKSS